ncbi:2-oxoacid:acceptor oxidoreductase family protein [Sedimentibacter sp.]|uniref:2-oxoacid:acceptor oxidoreductase family protein n=1 Tax=Sedimentibacter sp. TaxID=1960295 RepID=UPI0028A17A17|nr:2-oxoacid:acceptor oxidoreductase family protein [Sedimentibacter sp.]
MKEIRFHGRGGQGVIKSAQIIVQSVVESGAYAHFIPSFGVERKGSPVYGFFRQDNKDIKIKSQIYYPDAVIIYDESLMKLPATFAGLKPNSTVLINSNKSLNELDLPEEASYVYIVDATNIALEKIKTDIPNTVMLGSYARIIGDVDWDIIKKYIAEEFGQANVSAAQAGYDSVKCIKG